MTNNNDSYQFTKSFEKTLETLRNILCILPLVMRTINGALYLSGVGSTTVRINSIFSLKIPKYFESILHLDRRLFFMRLA
jgi:hypothetical protein